MQYLYKRTEKKCEACQRDYVSGSNNQKYCSDNCRREFFRSQYKPRTAGYHREATCDHCGQTFDAKNGKQRFCSVDCSKASYVTGAYVIYARDRFKCTYCGRGPSTHDVVLNADHVIPRSKGGQDIAGNLTTACKPCNLQKHTKELSDDLAAEILADVSERNKANGLRDDQKINMYGTLQEERII